MRTPRQAFIGVGGNLGDRLATLVAAVAQLRTLPGVVALESSAIYETKPVGVIDQPLFLNLVVGIETTLTPEELLEALQSIERSFGRVRTQRWGPRTLDLDLLSFEGETRATETLRLPHPRMLERTFVTVPLRTVLEKKRFQRPGWEELRKQLGAAPETEDVKRFAEGI